MLCSFAQFHFFEESFEVFLLRVSIVEVCSKRFLYSAIIQGYLILAAEFQAWHQFPTFPIRDFLVPDLSTNIQQADITASFQQAVCASQRFRNPVHRQSFNPHSVLYQTQDHKRHETDQKVCPDMLPLVQINRSCIEIALHGLERFLNTPQTMVYFPYLCSIIIHLTGYDCKISVIKGIFFRLLPVHCGYFGCLPFIQNFTGLFQDGFFFYIPVFSMDDPIGIVLCTLFCFLQLFFSFLCCHFCICS